MTQNETAYTHSVHIFSNRNSTESNEKDTGSFNMCLTLVHFKNFALPYSRVGAGAASKFLPGAEAA
jgi:hypothetical protein